MSKEVLTKRYLLDLLNATFFSQTISWEGINQFNQLPILSFDENVEDSYEARGVLFVHSTYPWALRSVVTLARKSTESVCYRIANLENVVTLDDPKRTCLPTDKLRVDFSFADTNLGLMDSTSYSAYDNMDNSGKILSSKLFSLLDFLINATPYGYDSEDAFVGLLDASASFPPIAGDIHYAPLYGLNND